MSKLSQLQQFKFLDLPTPNFRGLSWEDFQNKGYTIANLRFPVAVRSTFSEEDGAEKSYAGHFETKLQVSEDQLEKAIAEVFASYPQAEGNKVIIQEMIEPNYSGVLFAFHTGVWKLELVSGLGEQLVSGKVKPDVLLLPRFKPFDKWLFPFWQCWPGLEKLTLRENQALVHLSIAAKILQKNLPNPNGLDIEFAIANGQLYLLQARPITTPDEAEQVLTSANHKEILPPIPSRFMTALTCQSGELLFDYYRSLDPSLPKRSFIEKSAEMPWINLSALEDMMIHWGLPTRLVVESVGAQDFYQVNLRPYILLLKVPVFLKALWQQRRSISLVNQWILELARTVDQNRIARAAIWIANPGNAYLDWEADFQQLYVDLVTHMQRLTGAMSGPMNILQRIGWLGAVTAASKKKSASLDYLQAFAKFQKGLLDHKTFLKEYGHRGFYESDLGQPRIRELTEKELQQLMPLQAKTGKNKPRASQKKIPFWVNWIANRMLPFVHVRERLRHEAMKYFWSFREELLEVSQNQFGQDFKFWEFSTEELGVLFKGIMSLETLSKQDRLPPSGWDMDTFLSNRNGRRLPISILINVKGAPEKENGIGIFPGKVRGQVWRVDSPNLADLQKPDFKKTILVADALDPGWMPYFTQVDGVISYIGGLLSHASIVLREYGVPSITQLPAHITLGTGDWIEMDGSTGKIKIEKAHEP